MTVDNFFNLIRRCATTVRLFEERYDILLTGEQQIQVYTTLAKDYEDERRQRV